MRRIAVAVCVGLALLAGISHDAWAQTSIQVGGAGTKATSTHEDEAIISLAWGLVAAGHLDARPVPGFSPSPRQNTRDGTLVSFVAEIRLGHEWGGGFISKYLAGVRLTDDDRFKWPAYVQVQGGAVHFTGGTNAVVIPAAGLVFPLSDRKFSIFAQVGAPIFFFGGNTEIGIEGAAGLTFPFGG